MSRRFIARVAVLWFFLFTQFGFGPCTPDHPSESLPPDPRALPTLFVHGMGLGGGDTNARSFDGMRAWLRAEGFAGVTLHAVSIPDTFACVETQAAYVDQAAFALLAESGSPRINIVAHSLGGIAAREALRSASLRSRVARVVTIASPHHGTTVSKDFLKTCSGRQIATGSPFLAALNSANLAGPTYTAIWSGVDALMVPRESARLDDAANVRVDLDHVSLLLRDSAFRVVRDALLGD